MKKMKAQTGRLQFQVALSEDPQIRRREISRIRQLLRLTPKSSCFIDLYAVGLPEEEQLELSSRLWDVMRPHVSLIRGY